MNKFLKTWSFVNKKLKHWGIFIGLIVGCLVGLWFNKYKGDPDFLPSITFVTDNILFPVGNVFLQSLFMIIVPLVFSSLVVGVAEMAGPGSVVRLSKRLFVFYAFSTVIAVFIGQILMGTIQPGKHISEEKVKEAAIEMKDKMSSIEEKSAMVGKSLWPDILTKIVPKNIIDEFGKTNMLAIIFVSLLFGLGLLYIPNGAQKDTLIHVMKAVSNLSIVIIGWIMKTAPIAVMALLAGSVSVFGLGLMQSMAYYMLVMVMGLLLHMCGTYALVLKFLVRIPIKSFYSKMTKVFATAFSTSSSSATMPTTMETLQKKFGVPKSIVSFSIPIGTVVNMDGTALFEVSAALFIAQIFGIQLTAMDLALLVVIVFITSVGIAGVPGGSIPVLMSSIVILGIPAEGIAIILGVDRLMDMSRTVVNVTGDSVATLYLAKKEGVDLAGYKE